MEDLTYDELKVKLIQLAEQMGLLRPHTTALAAEFKLPDGDLDLVCFQIEDQHFALYLPVVTEAIRMVKLTPLPNVPPAIIGLLNLRRQIVPVIDLRILLGFAPRRYDENTPIILVEYENRKRS